MNRARLDTEDTSLAQLSTVVCRPLFQPASKGAGEEKLLRKRGGNDGYLPQSPAIFLYLAGTVLAGVDIPL